MRRRGAGRAFGFLVSHVSLNGSKMMEILARMTSCTWSAGTSFSSSTSAHSMPVRRSVSFLFEFFWIRRSESAR